MTGLTLLDAQYATIRVNALDGQRYCALRTTPSRRLRAAVRHPREQRSAHRTPDRDRSKPTSETRVHLPMHDVDGVDTTEHRSRSTVLAAEHAGHPVGRLRMACYRQQIDEYDLER